MRMGAAVKLLIVDDEERFRITLSKVLTVRGLDVATAGRAREALDLLQENPFDVVLLDVKMPEMNGVEALAEIKRIRPEIEVIILTGHASVDVAMEIMKLGGFDYLLKPCATDELIEKIEAAYERKLDRENATR